MERPVGSPEEHGREGLAHGSSSRGHFGGPLKKVRLVLGRRQVFIGLSKFAPLLLAGLGDSVAAYKRPCCEMKAPETLQWAPKPALATGRRSESLPHHPDPVPASGRQEITGGRESQTSKERSRDFAVMCFDFGPKILMTRCLGEACRAFCAHEAYAMKSGPWMVCREDPCSEPERCDSECRKYATAI